MSAASPPRVDIVTPCYNAQIFVGATLRSLLSQTLEQWRVTVVDDASLDGSVGAVTEFVDRDPRVNLVRQEANRGMSATRNRGARTATSDYLYFLDADDTIEPDMLAIAVRHLDAHPDVSAVYTGHSYIGPSGEDLGPEPGEWPWARCVPSRWWMRMLPDSEPLTPFESIFLVAVMLPSLTVMRRQAFVRAGGWDEDFGHGCEDTDLFLRLALQGPIHYLPGPLVHYRRHPGQASQSWDFEKQYNKLTEKWRSLPGLDVADRQLIADALWFRAHRFVAGRLLLEGRQDLRAGKWRQSLRLLVLGAKQYSPRRPPSTLYRSGPRRQFVSQTAQRL